MDEKYRDKHKKKEINLNIGSQQEFQKFKFKEKTSEDRLQTEDFASHAKFQREERLEFEEIELAKEIVIKSSDEDLELGFAVVAGTYSGYFYAKSKSNEEYKLLAELNDEADKDHPRQTFIGKGYIRTHVLPNGKAGDKAVFKVLNETTGEEAIMSITTVPFDTNGTWGAVKNLFS